MALSAVLSVLEYKMEPPYFPGEEGIHSCFALQLLIKEWNNVLGSLLSPFMTLMENALEFQLHLCFCLFEHYQTLGVNLGVARPRDEIAVSERG